MENERFISPSNERLMELNRLRRELTQINPIKLYPWWNPCRVKVLLVVDGLDFGQGNFGLSTFVSILQNDQRSYIKFDLTLAHILPNVSDSAVMMGAPNIVRSIKGFRFDNAAHFTTTMYDQVWLFGVRSRYDEPIDPFNPNSDDIRNSATLETDELRAINLFMNNGGGVFATGDHGSLGKALCSAIPRVRSMRLWDNTPGTIDENEVSMGGARRNDTNRHGHDGVWQFEDQSDDVPQEIQPKLYSTRISPFTYETFPHPLLCSRLGLINVLPDHPHEGECTIPDDLNQNEILGNREYPYGFFGIVRPEIIAHSSVLAGSGDGVGKAYTQAHNFGAISAYDGHFAGVGRVVTDATWHHFVNVNLVGDLDETDDPIKMQGYLASASGMNSFDKIKEYYINIGVWLATVSQQGCFNRRLIWPIITNHRVLEAAVLDPGLTLDKRSNISLYEIGAHIIDILGKQVSQCRRVIFILDLVDSLYPDLRLILNPWIPYVKIRKDALPWIDPNPLLKIAVGAGIVAVKDKFGEINRAIDENLEQEIKAVFISGAKVGMERGSKEFNQDMKYWSRLTSTENAEYVVKGFVFDKNGQPAEGLTVKAVDQDFTGENPLGETVKVDETGYFRIPYKATDFIIDGKETGGADIILYFYKGKKLVKKTDPYRNSPKVFAVEVVG